MFVQSRTEAESVVAVTFFNKFEYCILNLGKNKMRKKKSTSFCSRGNAEEITREYCEKREKYEEVTKEVAQVKTFLKACCVFLFLRVN